MGLRYSIVTLLDGIEKICQVRVYTQGYLFLNISRTGFNLTRKMILWSIVV